MVKIGILIIILCILPVTSESGETNILVVYYSMTGNTGTMAEAVAEGARSVENVNVTIKNVDEVEKEDLIRAHGIILGSPSYYANVATPMKEFIDKWYFEYELPLFDKVGGAFSSGGSRTGGQELVVISLLMAMMNNGMIIAGPLYEAWGTFGATSMTETAPHDGVDTYELNDCRLLGERVATIARQLN